MTPVLDKLKKSPDDPAANLFAETTSASRGASGQKAFHARQGFGCRTEEDRDRRNRQGQNLESASQLGDSWWKIGEKQPETRRVKTLAARRGFL